LASMWSVSPYIIHSHCWAPVYRCCLTKLDISSRPDLPTLASIWIIVYRYVWSSSYRRMWASLSRNGWTFMLELEDDSSNHMRQQRSDWCLWQLYTFILTLKTWLKRNQVYSTRRNAPFYLIHHRSRVPRVLHNFTRSTISNVRSLFWRLYFNRICSSEVTGPTLHRLLKVADVPAG
jgi:hypothetical protein